MDNSHSQLMTPALHHDSLIAGAPELPSVAVPLDQISSYDAGIELLYDDRNDAPSKLHVENVAAVTAGRPRKNIVLCFDGTGRYA